jgi:thioredoxin reductase (NADPH)
MVAIEAKRRVPSEVDAVVVGGGPAGLTAAIYLARFHLTVVVMDRGGGRATMIPRTRNHAGFPDGIVGIDLVERMRQQAARFGAILIDGRVGSIEKSSNGFLVRSADLQCRARAVLLATGVSNNRPDMEPAEHDAALGRGLLRYCPVCDGFEVTDKRIAVIGTGEHGAREAVFLRGFTADVTLIAPDGAHQLASEDRDRLTKAGIALVDGPCVQLMIDGDEIGVTVPSGRITFATAYPALGSLIHSDLVKPLGAAMSDDGCVVVDRHQRTNVPGLYAAGDVVYGLDQISHAMGEGGVAATTIRNDLAGHKPIYR